MNKEKLNWRDLFGRTPQETRKAASTMGVMFGGLAAPVILGHEFGSPAYWLDTAVVFSPAVVVPEVRHAIAEAIKSVVGGTINLLRPKIQT